jgi:hypothetical protein
MKSLLTTCFLFATLVSCVSGTVQEDKFCSTTNYPSIPVIEASGEVHFSDSKTQDLSGAISKIKEFGDVEVSLTEASLTSAEKAPLDFVDSLTLSMVNPDGSEEVIGTTNTKQVDTITFSLNTSDTVISAFRSGPVVLKLAGTGSAPTQVITPVFTICASAKANVKATLNSVLK